MRVTNQPPKLFIRDDDVGALNRPLEYFLETFSARNLPVSYQIIPRALTEDCAASLRGRRAGRPDLYEFAQHGLTHEMTVKGRQVFYEFGPERSYEQQLEVIRAGQALLRERLGDDFTQEVFTPPRHRYNRDTLKALKASGVTILSSSVYPGLAHQIAYGLGRSVSLTNLGRPGVPYHGRVRPDCGLFELSISVPVDDGSRSMATPQEVVSKIEKAARSTDLVGLMFHHNVYDSDQGRTFLAALADRLAALEGVSFHLLSQLRDHAAATGQARGGGAPANRAA